MLRRTLAITLVVTTTWFSTWAAAGWAQESESLDTSFEADAEALTLATLDYAHEVVALIDRSTFDLEALLEKLDFDCDAIVQFVTQEIGYEAYSGVLRGAQGTLMSRAGNAWDQSLLLATLLRDAGCDAVIRSGKLSQSDATRLVGLLAQRQDTPPPWDQQALEVVVAPIAAQLRGSSIELGKTDSGGSEDIFPRSELMAKATRDRDLILEALTAAGITLGTGNTLNRVVDEATDYAWVDYRLGPSDPWLAAHPSYGDTKPPTVQVDETYSVQLPPERTHRIRIEILVAQRLGDQVKSTPLMSPIEIPAASLSGGSVSVSLLPDQFLRQDALESIEVGESLAEKTRFLLPLVNGKLPPGGQALALDGTLVPPEALALGASGVFEQVSDRFDTAASLLQGLDGAPDREVPNKMMALDSLTLNVTILAPNGSERLIQRTLYSADGTYPPLPKDLKSSEGHKVERLAITHHFAVATGSLPAGYVLDATLNRLIVLEPWLRAHLPSEIGSCESLDCLPRPRLDFPTSRSDLASVFAIFDRQGTADTDTRIYRNSPNILRVSQPFFPASRSALTVTDIMSNQQRAFSIAGDSPVPAPEALMLEGVWHTYVERFASGMEGGVSAIDLLSAASREGRPLQVHTAAELRDDSRIGIPAEVLLGRDSAGGTLVLIPEMTPTRVDVPAGWWQVDPVSGSTLGMTQFGGAEITEAVLLIGFIAISLIFALTNVLTVAECWSYAELRSTEDPNLIAKPTLKACMVCSNMGYLSISFGRGLIAVLGATALDPVADVFMTEVRNSRGRCILKVGYAVYAG